MLASTLLAIASVVQIGGSVADNALIDGERVHLFLPPVLVCEGRLLTAQWADDGQYLVVVSEHLTITPSDYREYFETGKTAKAKTEIKVGAFSVRTGKAKELWSMESYPRSRAGIVYFRNSDIAIIYVTLPDSKSTVLRVTASTSQ